MAMGKAEPAAPWSLAFQLTVSTAVNKDGQEYHVTHAAAVEKPAAEHVAAAARLAVMMGLASEPKNNTPTGRAASRRSARTPGTAAMTARSRCNQQVSGAGSPAPGTPRYELEYPPRTIPLDGKQPPMNRWPEWQATRETVTAYFKAHMDANVRIRAGQGLIGVDIGRWRGGSERLAML
jgi:hypothetical protein